jgi:hypothetical protein
LKYTHRVISEKTLEIYAYHLLYFYYQAQRLPYVVVLMTREKGLAHFRNISGSEAYTSKSLDTPLAFINHVLGGIV